MTLHFFKPAGMNQYLPIDPSLLRQKPPTPPEQEGQSQDGQSNQQQISPQSAVPEDYQKILEMQTSLDFWKSQNGLDFIL